MVASSASGGRSFGCPLISRLSKGLSSRVSRSNSVNWSSTVVARSLFYTTKRERDECLKYWTVIIRHDMRDLVHCERQENRCQSFLGDGAAIVALYSCASPSCIPSRHRNRQRMSFLNTKNGDDQRHAGVSVLWSPRYRMDQRRQPSNRSRGRQSLQSPHCACPADARPTRARNRLGCLTNHHRVSSRAFALKK